MPEKYTKEIEFVDELSLKIEETGKPRIFGQILGWLVICDPPHQSFSDLMENLNISKASVSNITRMLLEAHAIEKVRVPGQRKIFFKLKEGALVEVMEKQMKLIHDLKVISDRGLQLMEEQGRTDRQRLRDMNAFYTIMSEKLPSIIEKFKEERHTSH